jgi:hypothetical protein
MIGELKNQKKQLISYLLSKVSAEDWHAVQNAASDIREIEARLEILNDLNYKIEMFEEKDRK